MSAGILGGRGTSLSAGAGVIGSCDSPEMDAGSRT